MDDPVSIATEQLRRRLLVALAPQVREALAAIPEDRLWWKPNPECNPAGVLVTHLARSIRFYLLAAVGRNPSRDRPAEFNASPDPRPSKRDVLEEFDAAIREAEEVFAQLTAEKLSGPSTDPRYRILLEDIIGVVVHVSDHVGQLVYLAKWLGEGRLAPDVWSRNLAKANPRP